MAEAERWLGSRLVDTGKQMVARVDHIDSRDGTTWGLII